MLELRINGFGGQGSVTLAHLLAQAALENGEQGQALPFFGVERRGALVRAAVRMSPTKIHAHSQCEMPDYVVVMSEKLTQAAVNGMVQFTISGQPINARNSRNQKKPAYAQPNAGKTTKGSGVLLSV